MLVFIIFCCIITSRPELVWIDAELDPPPALVLFLSEHEQYQCSERGEGGLGLRLHLYSIILVPSLRA